MSTPTTPDPSDDPIAEIHEIRRRIATQHGNDPRRHGESLRARQKEHIGRTVRVQKQLVAPAT
ncbi:MAG TPA: hypothetical protein VGO11_26585 [Chthoniobacteraceae bacterium]|jgi:hypothetical protein|nr:hypothetical protein [Chthoniobacteraceae bacterium]